MRSLAAIDLTASVNDDDDDDNGTHSTKPRRMVALDAGTGGVSLPMHIQTRFIECRARELMRAKARDEEMRQVYIRSLSGDARQAHPDMGRALPVATAATTATATATSSSRPLINRSNFKSWLSSGGDCLRRQQQQQQQRRPDDMQSGDRSHAKHTDPGRLVAVMSSPPDLSWDKWPVPSLDGHYQGMIQEDRLNNFDHPDQLFTPLFRLRAYSKWVRQEEEIANGENFDELREAHYPSLIDDQSPAALITVTLEVFCAVITYVSTRPVALASRVMLDNGMGEIVELLPCCERSSSSSSSLLRSPHWHSAFAELTTLHYEEDKCPPATGHDDNCSGNKDAIAIAAARDVTPQCPSFAMTTDDCSITALSLLARQCDDSIVFVASRLAPSFGMMVKRADFESVMVPFFKLQWPDGKETCTIRDRRCTVYMAGLADTESASSEEEEEESSTSTTTATNHVHRGGNNNIVLYMSFLRRLLSRESENATASSSGAPASTAPLGGTWQCDNQGNERPYFSWPTSSHNAYVFHPSPLGATVGTMLPIETAGVHWKDYTDVCRMESTGTEQTTFVPTTSANSGGTTAMPMAWSGIDMLWVLI
jgi:hypothetical protein